MDYVNNKRFLELIIEYRTTGSRKAYNEIGKCFCLIAENCLNNGRFINYTEDIKQELVSDATHIMCRYMYLFKEDKSKNPFAYFTRFAYNAYKLYFKKYYKRRETFINLSFIEDFDKELI
tara:strand:+ start:5671 stop:6030 length:360 start_codon:yes stop_codon:yes gene_type:complete